MGVILPPNGSLARAGVEGGHVPDANDLMFDALQGEMKGFDGIGHACQLSTSAPKH